MASCKRWLYRSKISECMLGFPECKALLMSFFRRFARVNINFCMAVERRFPRLFASKLASTTYLPDMISMLAPYLQNGGRILEVGGIDRPLIEKGDGYVFAGLDIEEKESCYEVYDEFSVQSVELPIEDQYDVIYSVTVLEHVPQNAAAARNMYAAQMLGGVSIHYVPCMSHPYGLLLRVVGHRWQQKLLSLIAEGERPMGGYPTFFDRCTPSRMEENFRRAGYDHIQVFPYYSPTPYFRALFPVHFLMVGYMHLCRLLGLRELCSGFLLVARRDRALS